jgi:hypothetical protein
MKFKQFLNEQIDRTKIAVSNASKFNTLKRAIDAMYRQKMVTGVLLGDDNQYWVPATNREMSLLVKAGYEELDTKGMNESQTLTKTHKSIIDGKKGSVVITTWGSVPRPDVDDLVSISHNGVELYRTRYDSKRIDSGEKVYEFRSDDDSMRMWVNKDLSRMWHD